MKNHFHFLVRIKEEKETNSSKMLHQHFSNLFNAYTKAVNKKYNRHSSLFQRSFKRKWVNEESYFKRLVIYIHNNPVNHQICENAMDYPWSSYLTCVSDKTTKLKRDELIHWFNDIGNFKSVHQSGASCEEIENYLEP